MNDIRQHTIKFICHGVLSALIATSPTASFAQHDFAPFVTKAKQNIAWDLKDPSSVQFRGLFISKMGDALILCGELNAKNSYGAYVGFRQFYASDDRAFQEVFPERPEGSMAMAYRAAWGSRCGTKVTDVD